MTSLPTPKPLTTAASDAPGGAARSWATGKREGPLSGQGPISRTPRLDFAKALNYLKSLNSLEVPAASRPLDPMGSPAQLSSLGPMSPSEPTRVPLGAVDSASVEVRRGQTLTSIVRERWARLQEASGQADSPLSDAQAHRWALQVARNNGLADPDRIVPGQRLTVAGPHLDTRLAGRAASAVASMKPAQEALLASSTQSAHPAASVSSAQSASPTGTSLALTPLPAPTAPTAPTALADALSPAAAHPVLSHTLDRAVARGYVPADQRQAVQQRIQTLADKHGFRPDDFARATLMESDGMNPRANNGRCFGIIQFCSGPDRGAASAGFGRNAQDILKLSVLDQLDLVDRYFDDTRLGQYRPADGAVRLDDLYLTILMPAARQERRLNAALPIPGQQALDLHAQRDRLMPITRQSILSGLYANARDRLGQLLVAASGK